MKNLRKVFAVMLALCMVIGTMTISAFADLGDYEEPYELYAGNMRATGVYVEPAATVYVKADNYDGAVVSAVAYLSSDLETPASTYMLGHGRLQGTVNTDGTGSLTLVADFGDIFSVYNSGDEAITVYLTLAAGASADTTGTMDDPEEIELGRDFMGNIAGEAEHIFEAGDEAYFYYVTAPADGLLSIGTWGAYDEEYNSVGWMYNVNSMEAKADGTYFYGDTHWSDDEEPVMFEELEVKAGEKYIICVNTYDPTVYGAVAGTMPMKVSFDPVGSYNYPDTAVTGEKDYTLEAGSQGYYVEWTAEEEGSVIITVSGENGWEYNVTADFGNDEYYYGDNHSSTDEVVVPSESIPVEEGTVIKVGVNTAMNEEDWSYPAGTVTLNIQFITAEEEEEVSVSDEVIDKIADASTYEGLDDETVVAIGGTYGENVLTLKDLEATTLKDAEYEAIDIDFVNAEYGYSVELEDGETVAINLAIDEIYADAETIDVYVLENGQLTKLTSCTVADGNIAFSVSKAGTYVFVDTTVEEETTETETTTGTGTGSDETTTGTGTGATPNTGDGSMVGILLALAAVSAIVVLKKKTVVE